MYELTVLQCTGTGMFHSVVSDCSTVILWHCYTKKRLNIVVYVKTKVENWKRQCHKIFDPRFFYFYQTIHPRAHEPFCKWLCINWNIQDNCLQGSNSTISIWLREWFQRDCGISSVSAVSVIQQKSVPGSQWDCGFRFRGFIATAESNMNLRKGLHIRVVT
jgi:hypothetical protein